MDAFKDCVIQNLNAEEALTLLPILIYLGLIFGIGCLGNGLSLFVYSTNFKQSNSRCFFIFLSAMELFSSAVIVPMEIYTLVNHYEAEFGNEKCRSLMFTSIWQVHASSTTLIVIALDRWRKICHPFRWQISLKLSKFLLVSLILIGFIVALPSIVVYSSNPLLVKNTSMGEHCYSNNTRLFSDITVYKCSTNNDLDNIYPELYVASFWLMVMVGVGMLSLFYWKIIKAVKKQESKFKVRLPEGQQTERRRTFTFQESIDVNTESDQQENRREKLYKMKPIFDSFDERDETIESLTSVNCYQDGTNLDYSKSGKDINEFHPESEVNEMVDTPENERNIAEKNNVTRSEKQTGVEELCTYGVAELTDPSDSHVNDDDNANGARDSNENLGLYAVHETPVSLRSKTKYSLNRTRLINIFKSKSEDSGLQGVEKKGVSRSRNVTLIMFVVTVSSVLSFIPYLTLSSMRALIDNIENTMTSTQYVTYNLCLRSYFLKSITNPVVYGLLDTRFRASVRKLFKKS